MKWYLLGLALVAVVVADELKLAESCDEELCKLPECRCSGTDIPGRLSARDTPQFVLATFDDAVNVNNILTYREVLYNRVNSNGCPAGATFYVSHEWTNYLLVNELYNHEFEIALHSISHQPIQTYWSEATYEDMKMEFADQKVLMAHYANIPFDHMKGIRIPYLQMTGNATFQVMRDYDIQYDCSWPTITYNNPGLWPYTLDYASTQDCVVPPCPTASIPGTWVLPMVTWIDLNGLPCAMADSCFFIPSLDDEEGWYQFIVMNFERQYFGNRSPFGFYVHEWYLSTNPAVKRALIRFLDLVNNMHDAFMVNSADVIDWVKNPVPLSEYTRAPCKRNTPTQCPVYTCGPLSAEHTEMEYWMQACNVCPSVYPWLGNPLGQAV